MTNVLFKEFINECENGYVSHDTLTQINEKYCKYGSNEIWNVGLRFACMFGHLNLVEFMISKGARNFKEASYFSFSTLQKSPYCIEYRKIADLMLSYLEDEDELNVRPQWKIGYKKYKSEQLLITKLHTDLILYIVSKYTYLLL